MKLEIVKDSTSKRIGVFIQDTTSTKGEGKTGLAWNSANLTWYYWRESAGDAGGTEVTKASATRGTFTSGGFVEKDATNMPGFYELGIPNAALATGSNWVLMVIRDSAAALNIAPCTIEIALIDSSSAPSAATIADAVWDEARADHTAAGSFGQGAASVQGNVTGSVASVTGAVGSVGAGGITAASIATGAIDADALAADAGTEIGTAVWATAARTLTSGANIVLAKGVGVTGFNDLSAAEVNAEVLDVVNVDTIAQLAQAAPTATPTMRTALMQLYMWQRNKTTETSALARLYDDAGTTCLQKRAISDDTVTFVAEEIATGP